MNFQEKLDTIVDSNASLLCVGLDTDLNALPKEFKTKRLPQYAFNRFVIETTHDLVCAYKLNCAFYEAEGASGIRQLFLTCQYLRKHYSHIPIILDAKRGDIGHTNDAYVRFIFDWLRADAVTLHPYLGKEALYPFLERRDKGCFILCRTSNQGAREFQDLVTDGKQLWRVVAEHVSGEWNMNNNCMLVVGATYPEELATVRRLVGDMTLLVPGVGEQGGSIEQVLSVGLNSRGRGLVINASRSIIFSDHPRQAAEHLRDKIRRR